MGMTPEQLAFVAAHPSAAMITVGADGMAKPARVGVIVVDGKLWSSGTAARVRTKRLRADPRCTLFVFDATASWLGLETRVRLLEGSEGIAGNLKMFRQVQGKPEGPISWFGQEMDEATFVATLEADGRLLYEFDVDRAYGLVA
jgi:hypothetical protein